MFRNEEQQREIHDLQRQVKELSDRLYKVEAATAPFRVGDFPPHHTMYFSQYWSDPRPAVSHEQAINLLMKHCGVEFKNIPGTPANVVLEKAKK
jgi:hypothetical protein